MDVRSLVAHLGLEIDEASFAKGVAAIDGLSIGMGTFAAAAGAAVAGALVYFTEQTAEAADAAGKLAQSTGLNSEFLQKLSYAADLADVSTEQLSVGLRHLAKSGVKDVQGEILRLSEQFQSMPNDGNKVALAMDKFGRSGAALIPLLNGGKESITELMQEAEDLGLVFSEEDSRAAEEFNDDLKRLSKSFTGLRNDIGRALIPVLHKLVNGMREFFKETRRLMPAFKTFVAIIKTAAVVALSALTASLLMNTATVASTVGWYIALGIASLRAAAMAAAGWIAANAPLIALAGFIALVVLALEDLYYYLTGGKSLLGKILPDLNAFIDKFTTPNPGDPWWLTALRAAVGYARDLVKWLQDLEGATLRGLSSLTGFKVDRENIGNTLLQLPTYLNGGNKGAFIPDAPSGAQSNVTLNAPITVNTTGGDANEIAGVVRAQIDEHHKAAIRAAAAGIE